MYTSNSYVLDEQPARLGELRRTPDHERSDRDALWRRLRRQGYLFLPGLLDPDVVWGFRRFYFDSLRHTGLLAGGTDPVDGLTDQSPVDSAALREALFRRVVPSQEYQDFCTQPTIRDWFAWMLSDEVHLHRRKILRHTRPTEQGVGHSTPAHYDLLYLRDGTDRVLSIWMPLGDCPTSLGGLIYLEGSHQWVLAEEAEGRLNRPAAGITMDLPGLADEHDARWLLADYAVGDVVVHSAHMVHAALDNVDDAGQIRLSTDIRYQRINDPIDWRWQNDWHPNDGL